MLLGPSCCITWDRNVTINPMPLGKEKSCKQQEISCKISGFFLRRKFGKNGLRRLALYIS
jgi:hypothetical protein